MALEALVCTSCGSSDVQEVKPGTYFCDHCECVFKHIDPTRVTVGPAFCDHGNPVRVQCQVCRTGMCPQQCDAVPAWAGWKYAGIVRTQGFGYLEHMQGYDVDVDGPFLSVGKLLRSLALARNLALPGDDGGAAVLSHACDGCVIRAVPVAADHVSAGAICETIRCWSASAGKCPCCQRGFCRKCSWPETQYPQGVDGDMRGLGLGACRGGGGGVAISAWDPEYDRSSKTFPAGIGVPYGMCTPCVEENSNKIASVAARICRQDYSDKLVPVSAYGFKVPAASVRRKKYFEERGRVEQIAARYAAEISARLRELVALDGNCDREKIPAGKVLPCVEYVIADERGRVMPAAVSEVIWAKPVTFSARRQRLSR
jgi:hypothetical protein